MTAEALVAWGAALGTFVASVMANDQSERLRNGAFGTIAGASLGGIAALFVNSKILVLYGVFGSALEPVQLGWCTLSLLLSLGNRRGDESLSIKSEACPASTSS